MYFNISLMPNKTPISTSALYFPCCGSENVCTYVKMSQEHIIRFNSQIENRNPSNLLVNRC